MKKPNDYDSLQVNFTPVELGAHKAVIKQVNHTKSKAGKDMYVVLIDFAPGDTQAGYFMESFKNDVRPDKKWPNNATQYILAIDNEGKTNRSLKSFITSAEGSNTGFVCNWTDDEDAFCNQFKNKSIGAVYGEQNDFYDGKARKKRVLRWFCSVNKLDEAGIPDVQDTQAYKNYINSAAAYMPKPDANGFIDVPDGIDEELPFN